MLQSLSDGIRNSKWLGWLIVSLISIPLALWGIGSYFGVGEDAYVAKVNGIEISAREYERAYFQRRNQVAQQFGGRLPQAFADGGFIKTQTVDSLILRELLNQTIDGENYLVADEVIRTNIVTDPQFQIEGEFNADAYHRQLRSIGMSAQQYEESLRRALAMEMMRDGVVATSFLTSSERATIRTLEDQLRSAVTLSFEVDSTKLDSAVSPEEIQAWFDDNNARYFHPEAVKLEYLELSQSTLADGVQVDDAQLEKLYEEKKSAYTDPEKRYARHVLITVDRDAGDDAVEEKRQLVESLRARIEGGDSFEEIAREHSQDPGSAAQGGDLGHIARGVMVKPFEDEVFRLAQGELSQPIKTAFGFHLIRVDRIEPAQIKPFADVRDELAREQQLQEAENLFFDRVDVVANEAYENPASLGSASEAAGIELQTTEWIERNGSGDPLGANAPVLNAAFSEAVLNDRQNSDLIEIGNNHVVAIRVIDHRERAPKTLDEVRDDVRQAVLEQRARDFANTAADNAVKALREGRDAESVASEFGARLTTHDAVPRNSREIDNSVRRKLFEMARPAAGSITVDEVQDSLGNPVVIALREVAISEPAADETQTVSAGQRPPGTQEYDAWIESLKAIAEIERREERL